MCCLTLALSSLSPLPVLLASRTQGLFQGEPIGYGASAATRGMARCSTITSVGRRCYGFAAINQSDAIWKHTHGLQSVRRGAAGGITLARGGEDLGDIIFMMMLLTNILLLLLLLLPAMMQII